MNNPIFNFFYFAMMNFDFSFVSLLFLIMLFVPNVIWSKHQPKDYEIYSGNENRILFAFERVGQILVTVFSLFCGARFHFSLLLILGFVFMMLYELAWIRYFRGRNTMKDMYSDFLKIPIPLATLPVLAFFLLGITANNIFLVVSSIILGIGHIGIHLEYKKRIF